MNVDEFLLKLLDSDCELKNIAFKEDEYDLTDFLSNVNSKSAVAVSSSFFNKNISLFENLPKISYIQSVVSLPIFEESSNLILVILNPLKTSDRFLLIDESDSLIHRDEDYDFSYATSELADDLLNSINDFKDSDNAICLRLNELFRGCETEDEGSGYDEILDLIEPERDSAPIKKRIISNSLVDDILTLKEERTTRQEIEKHNMLSIEDVPSDIYSSNLLPELMYSKKRPNPENILNKNNKPLIDGEVKFRKLGKIADLHNIDEKNADNTILVATCKRCDSKLVYYNHDVDDFKGEIFVEISNVSDDVSQDYLYEYLNSENGKDELLYFSKGYNYIRAEFINSVKIPVPPLEIQKDIVKVTKEAREFFKTVDLLKKEFNSNILDYKHISQSITELKGDIEIDSQTCEVTKLSRSWRHAFQGLIWPLAISYLSATKGGFEIVEKKENYVTLFEFIAAFNTVILLSGLPDDVYSKNFDRIWTDRSLGKYKKMTFGNWVYVSKNLAEVYKNNNFTSKLDEELFKKIASDRLLDILEIAKDFRNEEAHPSMKNAYEANEIVEILDDYLEDVFDILEVYSNYKLFYTTGKLESYKQSYNHDIILLNGPCAQPIYDRILFDTPLMSESLYLYNPKNNKKLLIKDSLMKFKAIDKNKKRWALFIYYSCDKKEFNAYYKCFQSKEKNEKESISSFRHDILS